jgi:hypothetical protein
MSATTGGTLYRVGETIDDAEFPSLTPVTLGTGRLTLPAWTADDGRVLATGNLQDSQFGGASCGRIADRCVPGFVEVPDSRRHRYFADRTCSEELVQATCLPIGPFFVRSSACGDTADVFRWGDAYSGPIYTTAFGGCATDIDNPVGPWLRLGAQVDLSAFASIAVVTE